MKTIFQFLLICSIAISCSAQESTTNKLEQYMDAEAAINDFAGTVLITRNDSVLLKKAYGLANYEWKVPHTIDTKFSLASVSKQFTAAAILQLHEANSLSIDDKLSKYYPDYPNTNDITIKMLLSHNAGISEGNDDLFSATTTLDSDAMVKAIMSKPTLFEPGTQAAYSNDGYYILATIIEKASGKSYAAYLKENIFEVANMTNSGVSSNDSIFLKMATPYRKKDEVYIQNPFTNWDYTIGMDGVFSTVEDLYLWNKALFHTTTILSEETKRHMFTSHNDQNFGYGVVVNPFYNHGHNLVAHDGGYYGTQSSFNKYTDDNLLVTVLSNNESPSYLIAYGLSAMALGLPVEIPYKHIAIPANPNLYSEYVGVYDGIKIHSKGDQLFYSDHGVELIPESKTKFFRSDNNSRTVEFLRNTDGMVDQIAVTTAGVKELKKKEM